MGNDAGEGKKTWRIIIILTVAVGLLVIAVWAFGPDWIAKRQKPTANFEESGQIGDKYGSVNALFSGLAFTVLIATLFLQREELQQNTKQLAKQEEALRKQVTIMTLTGELAALPVIIKTKQESIASLWPMLFQGAKLQEYNLHSPQFLLGKIAEGRQSGLAHANKVLATLEEAARATGHWSRVTDAATPSDPEIVRNWRAQKVTVQQYEELLYQMTALHEALEELLRVHQKVKDVGQ